MPRQGRKDAPGCRASSQLTEAQLLEANMRLKLSGPDYKDKDPIKSLEDFKLRVAAYERAYEPLGEYEEKHDMQFIQVRLASSSGVWYANHLAR
jgi:hypothetical protein